MTPTPAAPRVPRIEPTGLTGAQAELYALYASGARADPGADFRLLDAEGQLLGPPSSWMLNADLGLGLERLGREVRFGLSLPPRHREIVILLVAEAEDNDFERYAHVRAAARAGLTAEEIAGLADGSFEASGAAEGVLVALAHEVIGTGDVSDATWSRATAELGAAAVFEVVTLVGYYRLMALQLRTFRISPPI